MLNRNSLRAIVAALAIVCSAAFNNNASADFANGDFITYPQQGWGNFGTPAGNLMINNYNTVYPSTELEVGIPGSAGHSILLTGSSFTFALLPTTGADGPLLRDETNLTSTTSGTFGGDVLALQLSVDFSNAGFTLGTASIPFGDLVLTGFDTLPFPLPLLDGLTVRQFLADANTLLGGGSGIYTINQISGVNDSLTNAFDGGAVSQFAQDHLRVIPIHGDYNANGTVDAADYVLWRNGGPLANEVDSPGIVNAQDYTEWRLRFGNPFGSGAALAAVPEPATAMMLLVGMLAMCSCRRAALAQHPAKYGKGKF